MPKLHIIYIPGIGDDATGIQSRAVSTWKLYGVTSEVIPMYWADKRAWKPKFDALLDHIDEVHAQGKRVALVGASAGASAAINAFAARKDKLSGIVLIAGKVNHPETIWDKYHTANPSFIVSIAAAQIALKSLTSSNRKRILSIFSIKDGLLTVDDSRIPGARNRYTIIVGHPFVIALQISIGAIGFISFLKKQSTDKY